MSTSNDAAGRGFTMRFPKDNAWLEGTTPFGVTILVARDRLADDEWLDHRVRALWTTNAASQFELLDQRDAIVEGYPAVSVRWTWTNEFGEFVQDVTFVEVTSDEGDRMCVSIWATGISESQSFVQPLLARLLAAEAVPRRSLVVAASAADP